MTSLDGPPVSEVFAAVPVLMDAWEIECCAPPPAVGEPTSWQLSLHLVPDRQGHWLPDAVSSLLWDVEPWPAPDGPHRMARHGLLAALITGDNPPAPGRHPLTGQLGGTRHGGRGETIDSFPIITAAVEFLDVISAEHTFDPDSRTLALKPGTCLLYPTQRSPRWFDHSALRRLDNPVRVDVGLLMRVTEISPPLGGEQRAGRPDRQGQRRRPAVPSRTPANNSIRNAAPKAPQ